MARILISLLATAPVAGHSFAPVPIDLAAQAIGQVLTAAPVADELVARGSAWKFLRGNSAPAGGALDWTLPGFDDGAWETGPAGFGLGDDDDATVLSDMPGRYSTVYLRKAFEVAEPLDLPALEFAVDYDDGFIAFLNGREIARANAGVPGSDPVFDALATDSHEAGVPEVYRLAGGGAYLVAGTNVLAVQGLNAALAGGDFSLHPELRSGGAIATRRQTTSACWRAPPASAPERTARTWAPGRSRLAPWNCRRSSPSSPERDRPPAARRWSSAGATSTAR